jgi:hypothetical protein
MLKNSNLKLVAIIPYFGKLPNWFQLYLNSAGNSKYLDFLLLTDDKTNFDYPSNFSVQYTTFQEVVKLHKEIVGKKIYLESPYKLCDYRPCFGLVFKEYIKEYDFWGHCDIDLIFGDIDKFIENIDFNKYDRLFPFGHFSFYKNVHNVNNAFKIKLESNYPKSFNFDFCSTTTFSANYDEIGINVVFREKGFNFYQDFFSANTNHFYKKFRIGAGIYEAPSFLAYIDGSVYEFKKIENEIRKKEYIYFHLQDKKNIPYNNETLKNFLITDEGFIDFDEDKIDYYFERYGGKETDAELHDYLREFNENKRKKLKNNIVKELKYNKFKFFFTFYSIYFEAKNWLQKNKIK